MTMTKRASKKPTDAELTAWLNGVAAAVTPAELGRLVADCREPGRKPRRAVADREFAKRGGNALAKFAKRVR